MGDVSPEAEEAVQLSKIRTPSNPPLGRGTIMKRGRAVVCGEGLRKHCEGDQYTEGEGEEGGHGELGPPMFRKSSGKVRNMDWGCLIRNVDKRGKPQVASPMWEKILGKEKGSKEWDELDGSAP